MRKLVTAKGRKGEGFGRLSPLIICRLVPIERARLFLWTPAPLRVFCWWQHHTLYNIRVPRPSWSPCVSGWSPCGWRALTSAPAWAGTDLSGSSGLSPFSCPSDGPGFNTITKDKQVCFTSYNLSLQKLSSYMIPDKAADTHTHTHTWRPLFFTYSPKCKHRCLAQ